MLDSQTQLYY